MDYGNELNSQLVTIKTSLVIIFYCALFMFDVILTRDPIRIRQQIYDMVDDHVQFANSILQKQQFSMGSGSRKVIRLINRRIKVIESSLI